MKTEVIRMKKKLILISVLLIGLLSMAGCSKPASDNGMQNNNENATTNRDSNNNEDAFGKGGINESDVVKKTKENIGGKDVVKYELKDGSVILAPEGEDDLDKINDAIKKNKNKGGTKEII